MSGLRTVLYRHHSPSSLKSLFSSSLRSLFSSPRRPAATLSFSSSTSATASMAATATIEHVVLFKVRDSTDPSKVDAMVSNLRSLASLDVVAHLAAGPVLPLPHGSATGFTHLLHSRYRSKADLAAYSTHPTHAAVVEENVLPVCEDIMAMDWVADLDSSTAAPPGSAMRLTLAKPKEGATADLTATLAQVKLSAPAAVTQVSYGENFSPARAKGYGVGLLAVFRNLEELEAMDAGEKDLVDSVKEKVRPLLESFIVVDFEVPPPPASTL